MASTFTGELWVSFSGPHSPALSICTTGHPAEVGSRGHSLDDGVLVTTLDVQRELLRNLIHSHQLTCGRARTAGGHARQNRTRVTFHQRDQRDPEKVHF